MRIVLFTLSAMAGVVFFWLLAKVLFFGLALALVGGLMAAGFRKLKWAMHGHPYSAYRYQHLEAYRRQAEPLQWTVSRREPDALVDYRMIRVD